ncbi:MAG: hypothetical protein EBY17_08420 [Acidobacteriia bacterium]|nr:hypothetical protein [Terriglobia bacterium]
MQLPATFRRLIFLTLACAAATFAQQGEKLYKFHCAFCHGKGDDGMAANLVSPKLPHAPSEAALINLIKNGIPGSDMPASLGMTDAEIRQVATYVRALGRSAPQRVPGDAAKGQAAFGKSCRGCHMVKGNGGVMGPDLSDIGIRRSPANLKASITDPDANIVAGWSGITVKTKDGKTARGIKLNEDMLTVHLRTADGKIQSIAKSQTTGIERAGAKSTMPAFKQMSAADLDDVIAYLFTLRGE